VDVLLIVLLGLVVPLASMRLRLWGIAVAFVVAAVFVVGAQLAFNGGTIVTFVYPLVALIVGSIGSLVVQYFTETRERQRTKLLFSRFVPENVVDQVLDQADDDLRLGGVQREGTVMFSDLRGFTSFAETLEPATVIGALNRYLTAMSEAILDHGGTLVAYMGDGIMAVFGAPLAQDDHADRAVAAARDMLDRLNGFNEWLREEGLHEGFKMGIGLNSGQVMSGHVGSERRLEYTALGDTTNTAARLEGMTKGTPYQLYVADSTYSRLAEPAEDLVEVGEFEVRGRTATVKLWSLREEPAAADQAPDAVEVQAPS
jgi:adenylate cyclase